MESEKNGNERPLTKSVLNEILRDFNSKCERLGDADFRSERERVQSFFETWVERLSLGHWAICVRYHQNSKPGEDGEEDITIFDINVMSTYLSATIDAWLTATYNLDDKRLQTMVVHELMHIFLTELSLPRDDLWWHVERACSELAWTITNMEAKNGR